MALPSVAIPGGSLSGGDPGGVLFRIPNCADYQATVNKMNMSKGRLNGAIRTNSDLSNTTLFLS
jgi:hypothetical protein